MIYITGDTHGELSRFTENNIEDTGWNKNDYLIICGDFGYIFRDNEKENKKLDYLESKPYNICFCDGNHENFNAIFSYPIENWHGGCVHRIRDNVFHLMRGQVFDINGKKIFTMGGAYSIDRYMRKINVSYWNEEIPNDTEYHEAVKNLEISGNRVDIVISHTAPREIIYRMGFSPSPYDMELTGFLEWIMYEIEYEHWYFGHWHIDKEINSKMRAVFLDVIEVGIYENE